MLEGAEEAIAALRIHQQIDPDWKMPVTGSDGQKSIMTAEEVIGHLEKGDQFAQNFLAGLGDIDWVLLAGSSISRERTGPLTKEDVLAAMAIVEETSPPSTLIVIPVSE